MSTFFTILISFALLFTASYRSVKSIDKAISDAKPASRISREKVVRIKKEAISDFLSATSGQKRENIEIEGKTHQTLASSNVITFVGHNGLMDFRLDSPPVATNADDDRSAIILDCLSKKYFSKHLKQTNTKPLLSTSNLMAPEAYILHDSLEGWIKGEDSEQIRKRAANAYSKYQKISLKSAKRRLVTGW